jgi:hypothetical protein
MTFLKKLKEEKKEDSDEDVAVILEAAKSDDSPARAKSPKNGRSAPGRSVSFRGVAEESDLLDDRQDSAKTHAELLSKTQRLMEAVKKAEVDVSGEKAIRKKKEKSLMKLARELKKRNEQRAQDVERLGEVSVKFWIILT